jgi:hypothetical protein
VSDRIDFGGEPWQAIPRRILRDARLSPQAKGGLVTLLSHEEGWVRSAIAVVMHENRCGRAAARSIMRELAGLGYASLDQVRRTNGTFSTAYTVYAIPQQMRLELATSPGAVEPGAVEPGAAHTPAVVDPRDVDPLDVEPKDQTLEREQVARARNVLFDALAEATGYDPMAMTVREARACGVALAEIKVATPDLTTEELHRRATNYLTHFDGAALTPNALANQWSKCRDPQPSRPARPAFGRPDPPRPYDPALAEIEIERALEEGRGNGG